MIERKIFNLSPLLLPLYGANSFPLIDKILLEDKNITLLQAVKAKNSLQACCGQYIDGYKPGQAISNST